MNPQQIRIVVYSHDTYGLGNMRRMLAITQELIDENGGTSSIPGPGNTMTIYVGPTVSGSPVLGTASVNSLDTVTHSLTVIK